MKVLFITRKWPPAVGGMELYSLELSKALSERVDLDVRFLRGRGNGRPPRLWTLAFFMVLSFVFLFRWRGKYDVVHFGDFVLYPLAWWHKKVAPDKTRILSVFGLDLLYANRPGLAPALYGRFVSWARRHPAVDEFVACSKNTRDIALEMGIEPTVSIPLGIHLPAQSPQVPERQGPPIVLFVGRIVRRKGAAWFARNVLPLLDEGCTLHVIGRVWEPEEGAQLTANPRVVMHGNVSNEELDARRAAAHVIIMPNIPSLDAGDAEGFGLTALEAAASGTPLLAADLEGIKDAVVDGKTGFLLPPEEAPLWAEKITEVLSWDRQEREAFARLSAQTLADVYSWGRVGDDTLAVYRKHLRSTENVDAAQEVCA